VWNGETSGVAFAIFSNIFGHGFFLEDRCGVAMKIIPKTNFNRSEYLGSRDARRRALC
jgi:hypothetical protein